MRKTFQPTPTAKVTEVWAVFRSLLIRLQKHHQLDSNAIDELQTAMEMLAVLPLATDQYELARRRLENAEKYLTHREPGAAGYELRLLASNLKKLLGIEGVREPRRRLRR
jgi:hypothetical protein